MDPNAVQRSDMDDINNSPDANLKLTTATKAKLDNPVTDQEGQQEESEDSDMSWPSYDAELESLLVRRYEKDEYLSKEENRKILEALKSERTLSDYRWPLIESELPETATEPTSSPGLEASSSLNPTAKDLSSAEEYQKDLTHQDCASMMAYNVTANGHLTPVLHYDEDNDKVKDKDKDNDKKANMEVSFRQKRAWETPSTVKMRLRETLRSGTEFDDTVHGMIVDLAHASSRWISIATPPTNSISFDWDYSNTEVTGECFRLCRKSLLYAVTDDYTLTGFA